MNPRSGAYQHITIGVRELAKYFEVLPCLPAHPVDCPGGAVTVSEKERKPSSHLRGSFSDLKTLCRNMLGSVRLVQRIKQQGSHAVYLRMSYFDPLPLLLWLCRIPFFLEANGVQFKSRRRYYTSFLERIAWAFELLSYKLSAHTFFIGSYGDYWQLKASNWSNVENGIESTFIRDVSKKSIDLDQKLNLGLIARLMSHHQIDVLSAAIIHLNDDVRDALRLHLIGSGFEQLTKDLGGLVEVVNHGFLDREGLSDCMKNIDVGLIAGAQPYSSQMKLFDYGAAKCAVVAAKTYHLGAWFSDAEIEFFEEGDASGLSETLKKLIAERERGRGKGEALYRRIKDEFTWESIFKLKAGVIQSNLSRDI